MNRKKRNGVSYLIWLAMLIVMLLASCSGTEKDTSDDKSRYLTYGDTIGRDVDELYNEIESS